MPEFDVAGADAGTSWQARVLQEFAETLAGRPWCCDLLLRGSLARGSSDAYSDIDLVATVAEEHFDGAINDLTNVLPLSLRGGLPPWLDRLVSDFGGIGFVYLLQVDGQQWGEVDIYLLPHHRQQRLFGHGPVLSLRKSAGRKASDTSLDADLDVTRQRHGQLAMHDLQQAVLACYVEAFLLRKRLLRRDQFQTFADTYATAQCVRDLIVLACAPLREEWGWHGLKKCAECSPDPALVLRVLSTFAQQDRLEQPAGLSSRVAAIEEIVALLAPVIWREHGESFRNLGRYILTSPNGGGDSCA